MSRPPTRTSSSEESDLVPVYFFQGLFKKKADADDRAFKLKREGAKTRILVRKTRNGAKAYIVQTKSTIRRGIRK